MGTFPKKFILNMAILVVFGKFCFPLFGDQHLMCLMGSITSEIRGGGRGGGCGGVRPPYGGIP